MTDMGSRRHWIALFVLLLAGASSAADYMTTIAGKNSSGYSGDGVAATSATLYYPNGVAVDGSGNVYICDQDNQRIRKVDAASGLISTVAGNGNTGYNGDGILATSASLYYPIGVAVDGSGNIYISDQDNQRIRKVTAATGLISTVAGTGSSGFNGDGIAATSATLSNPSGVTVDGSGNIYICDQGNDRIRKVTVATGQISTVAGTGSGGYNGDGISAKSATIYSPSGVALDSAGNIYIADQYNSRIRKVTQSTGLISTVAGNGTYGFSGDGAAATSATMRYSSGVAVDSSGNIYFCDLNNQRIRKVTASTGLISTLAGNGSTGFTGDGGIATSATLYYPAGIAVDSSGFIYIADTDNHRIRKSGAGVAPVITSATAATAMDARSFSYAITNTGYPATTYSAVPLPSTLNLVGGLISGTPGTADIGTTSVTLTATNALGSDTKTLTLTINASPPLINSIASRAATEGVAFTHTLTAAATPTVTWSATGLPAGLTIAGAIISGTPLPGAVGSNTVSVTATNPYGSDTQSLTIVIEPKLAIDTYAGNGVYGFTAGPNGLARSANIEAPSRIAVDAAENIYFCDSNNQRIRKVDLNTGVISTVAGSGNYGFSGDGGLATAATCSLANPQGIAVDGAGNIYIADTQNSRIRKITAATGIISTIAGNGSFGFTGDNVAATSAGLYYPRGISVDSAGNLFIADMYNQRIRKVNAATGIISTVAGTGTTGFTGDAGPAVSAILNYPQDVAVDALGNLYVADTNNSRIRRIDAGSGNISTVAGTGVSGYTGDGGLATAANIYNPAAISILPGSSPTVFFIADTNNNRIRKVNATGSILTVAGNGGAGYNGDDRPAVTANLNTPNGVAVASSGNFYIADQYSYRIRKVAPATAPVIVSALTGSATDGVPFSLDVAASGFPIPSFTSSPLPSGLQLMVTSTGWLIKGTPLSAAVGTAEVTVTATNSGGTNSAVVTLTIAPAPPVINSALDAYGTAGAPFYFSLSASGTPPFTYTSSILPDGLTLFGNAIYGTPTAAAAGITPVTLTATNVAGSDTQTLNIHIQPLLAIDSVAGVAFYGGFIGDGGPALSATLYNPSGVSVDASGIVYIADTANNRVRKVDLSGTISTVAGTGIAGFNGDGIATASQLNGPLGVAVDGSGNVYIADTLNNRIRMVDGSGNISTVAGTAAYGFGGDGVAATATPLFAPNGIAVSSTGAIYIADTGNQRVRVVSGGVISTVAGKGSAGFSGDGALATNAALNNPGGVAVDAFSNVYIADTLNQRLRRVDGAGNISTIAGTGYYYYYFNGDNGPATNADLSAFSGVAVDSAGNAYIADIGNNRIRRIDAISGIITTVAGSYYGYGPLGDNGVSILARLTNPHGLALDSAGNIFVADTYDQAIRKVGVPVTPTITSSLTASGQDGSAFSYNVTADGFPRSMITTSTLPSGLTLSGTTISGLPTSAAVGATNVTLAATNLGGTGSGNLVVTIGAMAPTLTSSLTATGTDGSPFLYTITASGSTPITFTATNLPPGLTFSGNAIIGTPTSAAVGITPVTLTATNPGGSDSQVLTVTIAAAAPVITSPTNTAGTDGIAFSYEITASGTGPITYSTSALPDGLTLSGAIISGTPTLLAVGTTYVTLSATNSESTAQAQLAITIVAQMLSINSSLTATGTDGTPFSYTITSTGSAPVIYFAAPLPAGLALSGATISGTPTSAAIGTINVTLIALNSGGGTSATLALTINSVTPAITSPLVASGTVGIPFTYTLTATGSTPIAFTTLNTLPPGLSLNGNTISGTPTAAGTVNVSIQASNPSPTTGQQIVAFTISKANPTIVWNRPNSIVAGQPLSAEQLNATSNLPGTFSYSPPIGTVLVEGVGQTLKTVFTPADAANVNSANVNVNIDVNARLALSSGPTAVPNPAITGQTVSMTCGANLTGLDWSWNFGDGSADANGSASMTHVYTTPGTYTVSVTGYHLASAQSAFGITEITVSAPGAATPPVVPVTQPLTITKKLLKARNPSFGADSVTLSGTFVLPAGVTQLSGPLAVQVGGVQQVFNLNSKGQGKSGTSTFRLGKPAAAMSFQAKVVGDFLQALQIAGVAPATSGSATLTINLTFAGATYSADATFAVTGTSKGSTGK
jgi:PKD repeat protein